MARVKAQTGCKGAGSKNWPQEDGLEADSRGPCSEGRWRAAAGRWPRLVPVLALPQVLLRG